MSYIGKIPANAALTTSDLADGIVTAAKIEDGTVVAAEIASNAVTTAKINADAVTAAKIADDAISEEHLDVTAVTGHTAETSIADGDTILIHDASASALRKMTKANFVSGIASSQAVVYAQGNSGTSCSDNTITKIELENEILDTASLMASSRFTVTSDYQGKYLAMFQMSFNHTATAKLVQGTIRKNNSEIQYAQIHSAKGQNHTVTVTVAIITNMTTNDYLEFWGKHDTGSTKTSNGGTATNVKIFKIN